MFSDHFFRVVMDDHSFVLCLREACEHIIERFVHFQSTLVVNGRGPVVLFGV